MKNIKNNFQEYRMEIIISACMLFSFVFNRLGAYLWVFEITGDYYAFFRYSSYFIFLIGAIAICVALFRNRKKRRIFYDVIMFLVAVFFIKSTLVLWDSGKQALGYYNVVGKEERNGRFGVFIDAEDFRPSPWIRCDKKTYLKIREKEYLLDFRVIGTYNPVAYLLDYED